MRFAAPVRLERLELGRIVYGRWIPSVPTHPAHLLVSVLDRDKRRWITIQEIELPPDPRIEGKDLSQVMSVEEMDARLARVLDEPPHRIELGGVETDHVRIVCDREHPVWPNHGECNGGVLNVPFGTLNSTQCLRQRQPQHHGQALRTIQYSTCKGSSRVPRKG